ncbi:FKBP-type peptidyl-prolyl cis-trans isomerase [Nannocystaceae bacterium ST9]
MSLPNRSSLSSCLVFVTVALVACVDPPSIEGGKTDAAQQQPGKPVEAKSPPAPLDPDFAGTPVSTATLAGGLVVEDFVIGKGEAAKSGSEVSVHYTGTLTDGSVFDTSRKRHKPLTFTIGEGRVIKGWDQGLPGMKVGGKRRLTVPAELAYGTRKKGKIPPNSQLTFTIELVESFGPVGDPKGDEVFAGDPVQRTELERGLIVEEFAGGEGRVAAAGDKVVVHYTGKLDDGTVFDSSVPRKKPLSFQLGQRKVIEGWELGIAGMKVGGLRRLIIPAELAYGPRGKGKIPPNSRLTFTIELMAIRDAPAPVVPERPRLDSPSSPPSSPH